MGGREQFQYLPVHGLLGWCKSAQPLQIQTFTLAASKYFPGTILCHPYPFGYTASPVTLKHPDTSQVLSLQYCSLSWEQPLEPWPFLCYPGLPLTLGHPGQQNIPFLCEAWPACSQGGALFEGGCPSPAVLCFHFRGDFGVGPKSEFNAGLIVWKPITEQRGQPSPHASNRTWRDHL